MKSTHALLPIVVGLVSLWPPPIAGDARSQEKPTVQIPKAGVPEVMTMEGKFVRAAYNREGYVILGYQASNRSIGEEWLLLEVGMTVLDDVPDYTLTRAALSLDTPDGKTLPLPSVIEHREGNTRALQQRANVQRDSINYFPVMASRPCRIGFFSELDSRAMPVRRGRAQQHARLSGPALFQGARRHRVWPVLAQRKVRAERDPRAVPHLDERRRESSLEELQGHRAAGQRRVQETEIGARPRPTRVRGLRPTEAELRHAFTCRR